MRYRSTRQVIGVLETSPGTSGQILLDLMNGKPLYLKGQENPVYLPLRYEAMPQLTPQKEQTTVLLWEQVQAVQVSEPLTVPADAWIVIDGESPRSAVWTLPVSALLLLFMAFNIWYLLRSLRKPA